MGGAETVAALDKLRRLIIEGANIGSVEIALGELRGNLSFIREVWGMKSRNVQPNYERTLEALRKKHNRPAKQRRSYAVDDTDWGIIIRRD
jgi:hypothetical protein